ncbi:MAG TPA: hypothetical protein VMF06_04085 [Candidatus Limnocylindria bacterium]|nr:hypothetical protein [Candidatus Limnocylindria bacterium]
MKPEDPKQPPMTARDLEFEQWLRDREATPDDIWRKWVLIAAIVSVIVIGVVGFGYRPFKRRHARQLAEEAEIQLAHGEIEKARTTLQKAMAFGFNEPKVLRSLARYSSRSGLPDGVEFWRKLLASGEATDQDRIEMAAAALKLGRVDLVLGQMQDLIQRQPRNVEALRLLVQAKLQVQNYSDAIDGLRVLVKLDPGNEFDQVNLAKLVLGETNAVGRTEAKSALLGIASSQSPAADDAIAALANAAELSPPELGILLRRLKEGTNSGFGNRALMADLEIRLKPTEVGRIVNQFLANFDTAGDAEKIATIAWAERHSPQQAAEFLTDSRISTNRILLSIKAEALADAKNWSALGQALEASDNSATNSLGEAESAWLRARLTIERGRKDEVRNLLQVGINSPGAGQRLLFNLAGLAESQGFIAEAITAWEALAKYPVQVLRSSREIIRLANSIGDLAAVRRAVERVDNFMPEQPAVMGERAILDALFNERLTQASNTLAQLYLKNPGNTAWRDGLALARFRNGDANGGLTLLDEKGFDWASAEPRSQSIYVAVLGAAGQREAARRFARSISQSRLKPLERQLVEPWL